MKFALFFSLSLLLGSEQEREVWICLSESSTAYHLSDDCHALKRCTHEVITVTESEAKESYTRKLCGFED